MSGLTGLSVSTLTRSRADAPHSGGGPAAAVSTVFNQPTGEIDCGGAATHRAARAVGFGPLGWQVHAPTRRNGWHRPRFMQSLFCCSKNRFEV